MKRKFRTEHIFVTIDLNDALSVEYNDDIDFKLLFNPRVKSEFEV